MKKNILIVASIVLIILAVAFYYIFRPVPEKPVEKEINLQAVAFEKLPEWSKSNTVPALKIFRKSCKSFLKRSVEQEVGSRHIAIKVKDFLPACKAALSLKKISKKGSREFFEQWFQPYTFYQDNQVQGLFTGYYAPIIQGSLKKNEDYRYPLYTLPNDLIKVDLGLFSNDLLHHRISGRLQGNRLVPYHTRSEINKGALKNKSKVIVWLNDPVERQFLEIQGSGIIELKDKTRFFVGYDGENGQKYHSLAKLLIERGAMTYDNASMQGIKRFFEKHPESMSEILNLNDSFVFFKKQNEQDAFGAQGLALTAGYSLAVDRKWIPLGIPLWLKTTHPSADGSKTEPLNRLMMAQDTGGAIRGPVRGDVYWGAGVKAQEIAGRMKNRGYYWLLLPKAWAR